MARIATTTRLRLSKSAFSRAASNRRRIFFPTAVSPRVNGISGQRRYWNHTIRDESDLRVPIDYVHNQPLSAWDVTRVRDWPVFVGFHRNG